MPPTATTTETISSANELLAFHAALIQNVRLSQQNHRRQLQLLPSPPQELLRLTLISSPSRSPSPTSDDNSSPSPGSQPADFPRPDLLPPKRARLARYVNYVPEEETIRNDYSQRYVDTGEWPQNWVLGAEPEHRFEEYPKQQRLLGLKKASVTQNALPPLYLPFSDMNLLQPSKFDVILLDPPYSSSFTWDHLQELPIPGLAGDPSFVFVWVGSGAGEGLERGREILAKWGYRRCEDVVWVKTNKTSNKGPGTDPPTTSLLTRTKQHCLIGIRGTVRRSTDSWFVHCNVDTDVIFWEGDPSDPTRKPPEMYTLIENFCLGFRRLEIFGRPSSIRRGWVTVMDPDQSGYLSPRDTLGTIYVDGEEGGQAMKWIRETWEDGIKDRTNGGKAVVSMTPEIDALRPKSPFRPNQTNSNGQALGATTGPRFASGFVGGPGQILGQNQMHVQPMMGLGMNPLGLGMGTGVGLGFGAGVDEMMGAWNPMMGGMGNMNRMNTAGMSRLPMSMMGPMGPMGMMGGFGAGAVINGGINDPSMGWGEQAQFAMENGWDGDGIMMNMGGGGIGHGMNIDSMNINGGGMGMGQWGTGPRTF